MLRHDPLFVSSFFFFFFFRIKLKLKLKFAKVQIFWYCFIILYIVIIIVVFLTEGLWNFNRFTKMKLVRNKFSIEKTDRVQTLSSCKRRVSSCCSGRTLTCPRWTMADSALRILKMLAHCPRGRTKEKPTNGIGSTVTSGVSHKRLHACGKLADRSSSFPCSWISSSVKTYSSMNSLIFSQILLPRFTKIVLTIIPTMAKKESAEIFTIFPKIRFEKKIR